MGTEKKVDNCNYVFKMAWNIVDLQFERLFTRSPTIGFTRGHNLKIIKEKSVSKIYHDSFPLRVVSFWNDLSSETIHSKNTHSFHNKVQKILHARNEY